MYQSGSVNFISVVTIGNSIVTSFVNELFKVGSSQALSLIMKQTIPLHEVTKYLDLFMQFLIAVGILSMFFHWKRNEFHEEYSAFSLASFTLAVVAIVVPYLSGALNPTRLYQITLIFLAPFCVTGALSISHLLYRKNMKADFTLKLVSLIFAVFLLFNIGFVYEVTKEEPESISLSQNSIMEYGDEGGKVAFYTDYTTDQDVFSAEWMSKYSSVDSIIYATISDLRVHSLQSYGMISQARVYPLTTSTTTMQGSSYVYLQYLNVVVGLGVFTEPSLGTPQIQFFNIEQISPLLEKTDKIYTNGGSEIFYNGN